MDQTDAAKTPAIPEPVDGKFIYQIDPGIRIRFNADGWVEEIGKGGPEDPLGTKLHGKPTSKRDDVYARRYYDLYSRAILIDIHSRIETDRSGARGMILFKDLEPGSPMYERVSLIIAIANHAYKMNLKPLG